MRKYIRTVLSIPVFNNPILLSVFIRMVKAIANHKNTMI